MYLIWQSQNHIELPSVKHTIHTYILYTDLHTAQYELSLPVIVHLAYSALHTVNCSILIILYTVYMDFISVGKLIKLSLCGHEMV